LFLILNPKGLAEKIAAQVSKEAGYKFTTAPNKTLS
jgi:hypothetical protein